MVRLVFHAANRPTPGASVAQPRPWQGGTGQTAVATKTYKAKIYISSYQTQEVVVQADDNVKAKKLIDLQYNKPKYVTGPQEVRR